MKRNVPKPRNKFIYGSTIGVVSQLEFTLDQTTGEIDFGCRVGNTYLEISYDRPKRAKILSRIPQSGASLSFDADAVLSKNSDFIFAVDTNTRIIRGKHVSVTGIIIVSPVFVGGKEGVRKFWQFDLPFCLEFVEVKTTPENFGWVAALDQLWQHRILNNELMIGMIVDSDLGNINRYNQRKAPLLEKYPLLKNVHLIYASCDAGKETVVNRALAAADSVSAQSLRAIETGIAPFNEEAAENDWCERFRIITPGKVTRLTR